MFKVGDKVKIVKRCKGSADEFCHKYALGLVGEVHSLGSGDHKFQVKVMGHTCYWWCAEDEIELVQPKYKVGDTVQIVSSGGHNFKIGLIGQIVEKINNRYRIVCDNIDIDCIWGKGQILTPEHFVLISKKETPTKQPSMLTKLTPRQEKLDDKVKALIELGVINSSLELVDKEFVLNFLFDKFYDELGKTAMERVKQIKKEMKKDK